MSGDQKNVSICADTIHSLFKLLKNVPIHMRTRFTPSFNQKKGDTQRKNLPTSDPNSNTLTCSSTCSSSSGPWTPARTPARTFWTPYPRRSRSQKDCRELPLDHFLPFPRRGGRRMRPPPPAGSVASRLVFISGIFYSVNYITFFISGCHSYYYN